MLQHYHYIFTGAGCAGLSLLVHLKRAGALEGKQVLVIDPDRKEKNDRTWCFWEKEEGPFEPVVYHRWNQLYVMGEDYEEQHNIAPYTYKLIRGIDFYAFCRSELEGLSNIRWLREPVQALKNEGGEARVQAGDTWHRADYIFNSIPPQHPPLRRGQHWMLQHFRGWFLETEDPVFNPAEATLMDFRTVQEEGTTFFYVLPFSPTEALVEYTLFSGQTLPEERYEAALRQYVEERLGIRRYRVREREDGVIPMTDYRFPAEEGRVVHLGTAGGRTKGSSGYTFRFIQKHAAALTRRMLATGSPLGLAPEAWRFHFYDAVLLSVLAQRSVPGHRIFTRLFRRNPAPRVLQFLDNETSLPAEVRLISTLPTLPFLRAALKVR
ncbi:MAG TPA: lycopene cyclase family protein [Chitinophagaceae bacterium]|nr:lycopene cyclase family protein [Chitinophagaceae bacterium]